VIYYKRQSESELEGEYINIGVGVKRLKGETGGSESLSIPKMWGRGEKTRGSRA
jgi:hypothetical protein